MTVTEVVLATKRCAVCGEEKPATDFYRNKKAADGWCRECKACTRARIDASRDRRRAEMGEEAWLAHQRLITDRSRRRGGRKTDREYGRAQNRALWTLVDRHRDEFEHLLLLARRGEL